MQNGGQKIIDCIFKKNVKLAVDENLFAQYQSWIKHIAKECELYAVVLDEAVQLQGVLRGQFPHVDYSKHAKSNVVEIHETEINDKLSQYRRATDLLYVMTAVVEDLTKSIKCAGIFASTMFSAFTALVNEENISRDRLHFKTFSDLSITNLQEIIAFSAQTLGSSITSTLQLEFLNWELRLYYFIEIAVKQYILPAFHEHLPANATQAAELIVTSLQKAFPYARERAINYVENFFNQSLYNPQKKLLIEKIYFSCIMSNNTIYVANDNDAEIISSGFAQIERKYAKHMEVKIKEKIIKEALQINFFNTYPYNIPPENPDLDPIFIEINRQSGILGDKGLIAEYIVAEICRRAAYSKLNLFEFFNNSLNINYLPKGVLNNTYFNVIRCGTISQIFKGDMEYNKIKPFITENPDMAVFPTLKAKPDILTLLTNNNGSAVRCYIQVRARRSTMTLAKFLNALETLNPKNFFISASTLRNKWLQHWQENQSLFDTYVRIIVSFSGFAEELINLVNLYNQSYGERQPIILLNPQTQMIGMLAKNNKFFKVDTTTKKSYRVKRTFSGKIEDLRIVYKNDEMSTTSNIKYTQLTIRNFLTLKDEIVNTTDNEDIMQE